MNAITKILWRSAYILGCFSLLLATSQAALADVKLPRLVSDGAILQRDQPLEIWGWADDGEQVSVTFNKRTLKTRAEDGRWAVTFPAMKAGGPYAMEIQGNNQLQLKDIWLGDVWVASGQSNMELPIRRVQYRYPGIMTETNLPKVRQFSVPVVYAFKQPAEDYAQGEWKTATPENIGNFSAVGFFFAKNLYEKYEVPIGIVSISVGGSPVEAWASEDVLKKYPQHLAVAEKFKSDEVLQSTIAGDKAKTDAWYAKANSDDKGLHDKKPWSAEKIPMTDWKPVTIPGFLKQQNIDFSNGVIWFRKSIELSEKQAQQKAQLWLGAIVDGDEVFINGTPVGQTGYRYPPRIYDVPKDVLKAGKNTISIRLTSYSSEPGFVKDKLYALKFGRDQVSLEGEWQYKVGMRSGPSPATTTIHYLPSSLYKAKLAPMTNFFIKGVIWFQGESNVGRAEEYETLFPEMIVDWREKFDQGKFPFLFAQLANFLEPKAEPSESDWAALRDAQRKSLRVENTGMAVTIDVGEWNDIHPQNKKAVGDRLALAAQKLAYGEKSLVASGPLYKSIKRKGNQLIVAFDSVGKGLETHGAELKEIAIAGADGKFVWAEAKIQGDKLVVWSDKISKPVSVRYAWADNPEGANLYNKAGLPASSFQASIDSND